MDEYIYRWINKRKVEADLTSSSLNLRAAFLSRSSLNPAARYGHTATWRSRPPAGEWKLTNAANICPTILHCLCLCCHSNACHQTSKMMPKSSKAVSYLSTKLKGGHLQEMETCSERPGTCPNTLCNLQSGEPARRTVWKTSQHSNFQSCNSKKLFC